MFHSVKDSSWSARSVISAVVIPAVVLMPLILMAQEAIAPYCSNLKRVADLAMTNERFASISAKPRDENLSESTLALTGWNDCSVYGGRIYTCDSQPTGTAQEAQRAQEKIFSRHSSLSWQFVGRGQGPIIAWLYCSAPCGTAGFND